MASPAPARAGVFIYAKDPDQLAAFYSAVLGLTAAHRTDQMVVLGSQELQLILHAMPPHIAAQITITTPPELRESSAIKFFFTVSSIEASQLAARELGGDILSEQWTGPGFVVRNANDPEGNIFQVRQTLA